MMLLLFLAAILLLLEASFAGSAEDDLKRRLAAGLKATEALLADIFDEWQIEKYPNFLQVFLFLFLSYKSSVILLFIILY